mgnify:FL=1
MKYLYFYNTSIGKIGIVEEKGFITNICFITMKPPLNAKLYETDLIKETIKQINEYLDKKRMSFDIPINTTGNRQQQRVLSNILQIPYGQVVTYKELGLRNNIHPRAIGTFVKKNPIPIIIPCHRVLGSNGCIGGYSGGVELKKHLLELEEVDSWYFRKDYY